MHINNIFLEGLNCANCAAKIETEINGLEGVKHASLNFVSKKLTLESDLKIKDLVKIIEDIVKKIEPDVRVVLDEDDYDGSRKKEIVKLVIGGALFTVGVIFDFQDWLEFSLFLLSYAIVGSRVIIRAIEGTFRGQIFSEHFLMSIATIGAFFVGEYPEGVAVMLFYLLGEMLEDMAVDHSRKSISTLMDIRPDYANLKICDKLKKVSPYEVRTGDIIVVKPGEKIPLDGKVTEGKSMVDTAALTGESLPRQLEPGSDALSGFINKNGLLSIKVTKKYEESTVSKILDLVENASSKKAPTEKFITKFARYYTPLVVFGALAIAILPPLLFTGASFSDWIYRALVFLVISCPCALVLSIPLSFIGGIGGASKKGILVKGGNYLEALNKVESIVFDKTGTLTKGVFNVTEVNPQNGYTDKVLLEYAAYAESFSNHPIAVSILRAFNKEIDKKRITNYNEITGKGVKADLNGKEVLAGNAKLMSAEKITYNIPDSLGTIVFVAIDKGFAGSIVISDEVKKDAAKAIRELKELGVKKTVMLTGDLKVVANAIGKQLGIDEVFAELLPADKVENLDSIKSEKGKVAFVGDGINDAPVLARADIAIAMGGLGSDAAIEAADIVIMTDEPSKITTAIRIAKKTRNIAFQNIIFALSVKGIFLLLGALGIATMWEAVFADTGVALIAVINAMRAMNTKNY